RTGPISRASMALFQKLLLRQTQALVMTPQLMQAIKLLQLSHLDLATYVDGELERNPLLERPAEEAQPGAYSEWAGVGPGGRSDGEYNLEAFVTAETTLAGHLAEQVSLTFTDPVDRMIAQYLADLVDEAGYVIGALADVAEKLGATLSRVEAV